MSLGLAASAWAAPSLPGSNPEVRALEQNRGGRQPQAEVQQAEQMPAPVEEMPQKLLLKNLFYRAAGNRRCRADQSHTGLSGQGSDGCGTGTGCG